MVKQRLWGSLSELFTAYEIGLVSVSPKLRISDSFVFPSRALLSIGTIFNAQSDGIWNVKRSIHSDSDGDDFSELGQPVSPKYCSKNVPPSPGAACKLRTEKREHIMISALTRKGSRGITPKSGGGSTLSDILSEPFNSSEAHCLKLINLKKTGRSDVDDESVPRSKDSRFIVIEKVPTMISLSQLKESLSVFGKISDAFRRTKPDDLDFCEVEFESIESSKRAISAGGIVVGCIHLSIHPLPFQRTATIRICNIGEGTPDFDVRSMCKSYGPLESLERTKPRVAIAVFLAKENGDIETLLEKLNSAVVNGHRWSCCLQSTWARVKIGEKMNELRRAFEMKLLQLEDLKYLHDSIEHLKAHPAAELD